MSQRHPTPVRLAGYADHELTPEKACEVEHHLVCCHQCQAELAQLRSLSGTLQEFGVPEALGEHTWDRVARRLSEREKHPQQSQTGLLRWLPPVFLIGATVMLQAVLIITPVLWLLSSLGPFDVRAIVLGWLPAGAQIPSLPLEDVTGSVLSWLVAAPLGPSLRALIQSYGVDVTNVLSWLVPSGLGTLASIVLTLLYLSWLTAYWKLSRHNQQTALPAA